jgi:plastocyanin
MFTLSRQLFGLVAALALVLAAISLVLPGHAVPADAGAGKLSKAGPDPLAQVAVRIVDFQYQPATVTVRVGSTVTWTNGGPGDHSVTSQTGAFDSGSLGAGETWSHVFGQAGTFAYVDMFNNQMRGTVIVTP